MNLENQIHLVGHVVGSTWTRWHSTGGRGQVRFWLGVSRELAGEGQDIFLCAIEPKTAPEIAGLEKELRQGRQVALEARAKSLVSEQASLHSQEASLGVIFISEQVGLDGHVLDSAHKVGTPSRHQRVTGKMAAAGDVESQPELIANHQ